MPKTNFDFDVVVYRGDDPIKVKLSIRKVSVARFAWLVQPGALGIYLNIIFISSAHLRSLTYE
jgi:hypothetical protein